MSINIKVLSKGIQSLGKIYNVLNMSWCVFIINITRIPFIDDQCHVSDIEINYVSIDMLIIYIICSIINEIHNNTVVVRSQNLRVLLIDNSGIAWLITCIFNFRISGYNYLYLTIMKTSGNCSANKNFLIKLI